MMAKVLNRHTDDVKGAVYIGRGSKYGNPFIIGIDGDRDECCNKYEEWLLGIIPGPNDENPPNLAMAVRELKGKDLSCYCAPLHCHGDLLIQYVNRGQE